MNEEIIIELQVFLQSIFWGCLLLIIYDVLKILRSIIKHNKLIVIIQDIIFWVLCSVFVFSMMYKKNDGTIRAFIIMGMIAGMSLYNFFISEGFTGIVLKIYEKITQPIRNLIKVLKSIIKKHFIALKYKVKWVRIIIYKKLKEIKRNKDLKEK